jgi:GxxExxY protein
MPITSQGNIQRLSQKDFGDLCYQAMPHIYASQRELGNLADESVYQADIVDRLASAGFAVEREVWIECRFADFVKRYFIDLVINGGVIVELKAVRSLLPEHKSQLLNYLHLLDVAHGKLANLRSASVEERFVNSQSRQAERRNFEVDDSAWRGEASIKQTMIDLLQDWGTGLEIPLYHQALVHYMGGEPQVIRELPMWRQDIPLGNQRFSLMGNNASFRLTAFDSPRPFYPDHLRRLLKHSPLEATHWINIDYKRVTFTTIYRS